MQVTPVHIWKIGGSIIGVSFIGFAGWAFFRNNYTFFKGADRLHVQYKNVALFQRNGLDEEAFTALVQHFQHSFSKGELDKVTAEKALDVANFHFAVEAQLRQSRLAIEAQLKQSLLQKEQAETQARLQKEQAETQTRLQKEQAETQARLQKEQAETQATKHHDEVVDQAKEISGAVTKFIYAAGIAYAGYSIREAVRIYMGK
jgi:hypothetical protein